MRSARRVDLLLAIALMLALADCGNGNPTLLNTGQGCPTAHSSCGSVSGPTSVPTSSSGSLPLYVADAKTTGPYGYPNEPLVSVTICSPNHTSSSQCQTISNILLDTGSYGLRIFGSAIDTSTVQLAQQTITVQGTTLDLAECALFGTGSDWGAVKNADVLLGGQTAANIPIQVIDPDYYTMPSACSDMCPDMDPCSSGYNGILGVGTFTQDCGTNCSDTGNDQNNPGTYFGCDGTGCYDAVHGGGCGPDGVCVFQVPLSQQVSNPVAAFSSGYNNGVAVTLPSVGSSGSSAITDGSVGLGIGSPSSVTVYPADPNGMTDGKGMDLSTTYNGTSYGYSSTNGTISFIDSGSNGIFFPGDLATCPKGAGFFCPSSEAALSAAIAGYSGTPSNGVNFSVGNAEDLFGSGLSAFDNVGGPSSSMFDWGLPFFFGRTIYVGLAGANATINGSNVTGPYWAF